MNYWLLRSEPDVYSIDDLKKEDVGMWEGCRNYTVRNFLRDRFKVGDLCFFYHSNIAPVGIIGIMEVVREAYPDPTQFDPKSEYYDPKADPANPRWLVVDVKFVKKFDKCVELSALKANPKLASMGVVMKGQRLSIMPVTDAEWTEVLRMTSED
ncbi:MAG: EVE domain-containing protein [Armatimonadetes bacterium]|nr:EVE domain-containing protein [Armatimonadota bacterium]